MKSPKKVFVKVQRIIGTLSRISIINDPALKLDFSLG